MDGKSLDIAEDKVSKLREIFPEAFTENKVDWEKLKAALGESINFSNERYVLNWAGKSDAFKVLQTPTTKTLVPKKEESLNFDNTEHIFIEGENLEVLKTLQKSYFGKVKMIYIDPPYNTGNDSFIYPDKFSETKEEYQKRIGDKDSEGYMTKEGLYRKNSKENGQYHSNWLNMMYPRLFLAKNLLKQDGVIFISIDDNEVHNLRLMMNEVFGEENFISQSFVISNPRGRQSDTFVATVHDSLLIYAKNINTAMIYGKPLTDKQKEEFNLLDDNNNAYRLIGLRQRGSASLRTDRPDMYFPIYVCPDSETISLDKVAGWHEVFPLKSDGTEGRWMWGKKRCKENPKSLVAKLIKRRNEYDIFVKDYMIKLGEERTRKYKSVWDSKGFNNQAGTQEVKAIMDGDVMSFPKSKQLLFEICTMGSSKNDIILDFFSGSGTTADAVMNLNKEDGGCRKYICVQLPETTSENSEAFKKGYITIADIAKERIRRAGNKLKEENLDYNGDLGVKVFKLEDSNFKQWQNGEKKSIKALEEQIELFIDPVSESATPEKMVYELLLKSGKDLNSKVEKKGSYYSINNNEIIFLLEAVLEKTIDEIIEQAPSKVIALDKVFEGNDQLKTNTVLQMRDAGIEFKTI